MALGFSAGDPGSNPSGSAILVLSDYAITVYLSSIKFNSKHQQGIVAQAVSPLGCSIAGSSRLVRPGSNPAHTDT